MPLVSSFTGTFLRGFPAAVAAAASDAFNIANLTDDNIRYNFGSQHTLPRSIEIKPDGTKLYMTGSSSGGTPGVYQYTLSSPFDLSSIVYDNTLLDTSAYEITPITFTFKPDGTKLWVIGGQDIHQHSLGTVWDVGTATLDATYSGTLLGASQYGMAFNPTGTKLIVQASDVLREYAMSSAYDISSLSYNNVSYTLPVAVGECRDIEFTEDGLTLILSDRTNDQFHQLDLSTPYDISTITNNSKTYTVTTLTGTTNIQPTGFALGAYDQKLYMVNQGNDNVYQFDTGYTPAVATWTINDISTDVTGYDNKLLNVGAQEGTPHAIQFSTDGTEFYAVGISADRIQQYTCSTSWDISTATHTRSSSTLAFGSPVWGNASNNPYGMVFKPDGTKVFIVGSSNNNLCEATLTTPWDVSTLTSGVVLDLATLISGSSLPAGLVFKPDGTRAWVQNNLGVNEINFSVPWDVSSATFSNVNAGLGNWGQMHFNSDGTQVFVRITTGIRQYAVPTPYSLASINTASYVDWDPIPVTSLDAQTRGFCMRTGNGRKVYVLTRADLVEQHSVSSTFIY